MDNYYVRKYNTNYREVYFISGRAAQAAELNDVQFMIKSDIQKLSDNLFTAGQFVADTLSQVTIVEGGIYLPGGTFFDGELLHTVTSITLPLDSTTFGISVLEGVVTEIDDPALRSPAEGMMSYNQVGAARRNIIAAWSTTTPPGGKYYPLLGVNGGVITLVQPQGQIQGTKFEIREGSLPLSTFSPSPINTVIGCVSASGEATNIPIATLGALLGIGDVQWKDNLTQSVVGTSDSANMYPSVNAVRNYVDSRVTGTIRWRGVINGSSATFPSSGGSGVGGGIATGDSWTVNSEGTLLGVLVYAGDTIVSGKDAPSSTLWVDWNIIPGGLNYSPENSINKVNVINASSSTIEYPSAKAVYDAQQQLSFDTVCVGAIVYYPVSTAPAGWLVANGSTVSRAAYPRLFSLLGTMYGVGDGSTTFGLPNLTGRSPIGVDSGSPLINTVGKMAGEIYVTLTLPQIPPHSHSIDGHPQNRSDGNHDHPMYDQGGTRNSGSAGGGEPHLNLHPVVSLLPLIKY